MTTKDTLSVLGDYSTPSTITKVYRIKKHKNKSVSVVSQNDIIVVIPWRLNHSCDVILSALKRSKFVFVLLFRNEGV